MTTTFQWVNEDASLTFNDLGSTGISDSRTYDIPPVWNLLRVIVEWADVASPSSVVGGKDYNVTSGLWSMSLSIRKAGITEAPFWTGRFPCTPSDVQASRDALGTFWNATLAGGPLRGDIQVRRSSNLDQGIELSLIWTYQYSPAYISNPAGVANMQHMLQGSIRMLLSNPS